MNTHTHDTRHIHTHIWHTHTRHTHTHTAHTRSATENAVDASQPWKGSSVAPYVAFAASYSDALDCASRCASRPATNSIALSAQGDVAWRARGMRGWVS